MAAGVALVGGCAGRQTTVPPTSARVRAVEERRTRKNASIVDATLTASAGQSDLGGLVVPAWAYGGTLPGPPLHAAAGDVLRVAVRNELPEPTSVHWHGVRLRNDMDGVPGLTQPAIAAGASFLYEFTVPDPGTYWFHPHSGLQLDRGLYGVLIVDDPDDPGAYDVDATVVLDDWTLGVGQTPEELLAGLVQSGGHMGMGGMGGGGSSILGGSGGDVEYPLHLANGRVARAPAVVDVRPGQRLRLRLVNAAADTAYRAALAGHHFTLTHSDGFPLQPTDADAVVLGMGERLDVTVVVNDGVFPLVAVAEGKTGLARVLVRTSSGSAPDEGYRPGELTGRIPWVPGLPAAEDIRLPGRTDTKRLDVALGGGMHEYRWTINGRTGDDPEPLVVSEGDRVRLRLANATMMFHPMHLHGHTVQVAGGGPRKDTVVVRPHERLDVVLDADNPGQWMLHCHNAFHMETGMMTRLDYAA